MRALRLLVVVASVALVAALAARQYAKQQATVGVYTGTIEAEESRVGSTVGGRVSQTLFREGETVRPGDR